MDVGVRQLMIPTGIVMRRCMMRLLERWRYLATALAIRLLVAARLIGLLGASDGAHAETSVTTARLLPDTLSS